MGRNTSHFDSTLKRAVLGLACACAAYGQTQVRISGRIADATGVPIGGRAISVIHLPSASSPQPKIYRATSASDGSYIASVTLGSYRICVEEAEGYLDPCQWQLGSTDTVITGPATRNIILQKGRSLIVRIVDPAGLLSDVSAKVFAPTASASIIDVSGKTRLIPFRKTAGAVHEFSELVPLASYTLRVASSAVTLEAPDGTILPAGGYSASVNTAVAPPPPPAWLPIWLTDRSARTATIVVLKVAGQ